MRTSRRKRARGVRRNSGKKDIERLVAIARAQGWVVDKTQRGHWRFLPVDRSRPPIIGSGTPGGARSFENLKSQLRRAGLQINRRRTSRNPIPPQPKTRTGTKTLASRHFGTWLERTYAPGTPVMFARAHPAPGIGGSIPAGARGVVDGVQLDLDVYDNPDVAMVHVKVTDARDASGLPVYTLIGRTIRVDGLFFVAAGENMVDWLVPLQDNWAVAPSRSSRAALPPSQRPRWKTWTPNGKRRTSRRNPIPAPPSDPSSYRQWANIVFAPGMPVEITRPVNTWRRSWALVPAGARATVVTVGGGGYLWKPEALVRISDARDRSGLRLDDPIGQPADVPIDALRPLVDNWGTAPLLTRRYQLPRSQRAATRPNRRTSRRRR